MQRSMLYTLLTICSLWTGGFVNAQGKGSFGPPPDKLQYSMRLANAPAKKTFCLFGASSLPTALDWKAKGKVTSPRNQGSCGSCWAFATLGLIESRLLMHYNESHTLSVQYLLDCGGRYDARGLAGCSGGYEGKALEFFQYNVGNRFHIQPNPPPEEFCYPYTGSNGTCQLDNKCKFYRTGGDFAHEGKVVYYDLKYEEQIAKESIKNAGPAIIGFVATANFYNYWYNSTPGSVYLASGNETWGNNGHSVLVYGWDDNKQAWLCQNSWGRHTGPNRDGTFYLHYANKNLMQNFYIFNLHSVFQVPSYVPLQTTFMMLRSVNYPDRYMKHESFRVFARPLSTGPGKASAEWFLRPGLAKPDASRSSLSCVSFEASRFPGYFVRNFWGGVFIWNIDNNDSMAKGEATWCKVPGLSNSSYTSFQNLQWPDLYLRHSHFLMFGHAISERFNPLTFHEDATWTEEWYATG